MESVCKNCNKIFAFSKQGKVKGVYCGLECTFEDQRRQRRQNFLEGKVSNRGNIKKHLVDINGWQCVCCKTTEWHGKPVPLEVDHIDGNAGDNTPANLRLLCPNCHAQTPTHKAKNKGNGRGSRGLPWN